MGRLSVDRWEWASDAAQKRSRSDSKVYNHYTHVRQVFANGAHRTFRVGDTVLLRGSGDATDDSESEDSDVEERVRAALVGLRGGGGGGDDDIDGGGGADDDDDVVNYLGHVVDLFDASPVAAADGAANPLLAEDDEMDSDISNMRIVLRWFYTVGDTSSQSIAARVPPTVSVRPDEYLFSDHVEVEPNDVYLILGRAVIVQTERQLDLAKAVMRKELVALVCDPDSARGKELARAPGDRVYLVRWFYGQGSTHADASANGVSRVRLLPENKLRFLLNNPTSSSMWRKAFDDTPTPPRPKKPTSAGPSPAKGSASKPAAAKSAAAKAVAPKPAAKTVAKPGAKAAGRPAPSKGAAHPPLPPQQLSFGTALNAGEAAPTRSPSQSSNTIKLKMPPPSSGNKVPPVSPMLGFMSSATSAGANVASPLPSNGSPKKGTAERRSSGLLGKNARSTEARSPPIPPRMTGPVTVKKRKRPLDLSGATQVVVKRRKDGEAPAMPQTGAQRGAARKISKGSGPEGRLSSSRPTSPKSGPGKSGPSRVAASKSQSKPSATKTPVEELSSESDSEDDSAEVLGPEGRAIIRRMSTAFPAAFTELGLVKTREVWATLMNCYRNIVSRNPGIVTLLKNKDANAVQQLRDSTISSLEEQDAKSESNGAVGSFTGGANF